MRFETLSIENFLAIGSAKVNLANRGLVAIEGVNEDDSSANSNGVGKSSISDALCWALYGTTARGVSGDSVINKTAKKNCKVSIVGIDGDWTYIITRHRKHHDHKNATLIVGYTEGSMSDLTRATEAETQKAIERIIGCSVEVFMGAIYAGQEVAPDLPSMTDKNLKLIIEEAAGTSRLAAAYTVAQEKYGEARVALENVNTKLVAERHTLAMLTEQLAEDERDASVFEVKIEDEARAAKEKQRTLRGIAEGQLSSLNALPAEETLLVAREKLTERLNGRSEIEKAIAVVNGDLSAVKTSIAKLEPILGICLSEISDTENQIKNFKPATSCPTCGQAWDKCADDNAAKLEALANRHLAANKKRDTLNEQVEAAHVKRTEHEARLGELTKSLPDVSETIAKIQKLNDVLKKRGSLAAEIAETNRNLEAQILAEKKSSSTANPFRAKIEKTKLKVSEKELQISELEKVALTQGASLTLLEHAKEVFGPAGVRAHILDTVTPYLNERTANYLSILSDGNIHATWTTLSKGAKGDFKEKFSIEVENDKGAERFAGLSGGEKRKVRLSCMLALQDLVATRASKPIDLWIGDEIDDALDSSGLERLMTILDQKARERGTVMVISHRGLRDWIDQTITVVKKDGVSGIAEHE